tara:strand:- start:2635 stop:2802 length:168 start_codon:yes stop_codon:yes gene_type:complete
MTNKILTKSLIVFYTILTVLGLLLGITSGNVFLIIAASGFSIALTLSLYGSAEDG